MTVQIISQKWDPKLQVDVVNYAGLSTDVKPTILTPGSTFHESDTGDDYISGPLGWTAKPAAGSHSVVIAGSIPAGANNIGKVTLQGEIPAGTKNIGDVDVATLPGTAEADIANIRAALALLLAALPDTATGDLAAIAAAVAAATPAGEAHIGETGRWSDLVVVTPAIAAAGFSAKDVVGGKLTLTGAVRLAAGKGKITGVKLVDASKQNADMLIFIFGADLAGSYADNDAEAVTAADWLKWIGTIKILSTDYEQMANASLVDLGFELDVKAAAGTTLYALIVTTGTPTYDEDALQLTFAVGEGN